MVLIRYFWTVFLPVFLLIFSTTTLAELDPEISRQIAKFDSMLTKNEKAVLSSKYLDREELKELEQSVIKIRSQTNACITNNQDSVVKIDGEIERCFITDIDYYWKVVSEINFAIAGAFKKAGIEIPFPQTDLHVKSSDISALNRSK
jgi:hypothetical protein